ncbi:MAG TPA: tetratricopeptide repeat protein [Phycisphaerales bacterium]|nr:tetratricopeptide repeat protein [Phycisphaerales bacterium]
MKIFRMTSRPALFAAVCTAFLLAAGCESTRKPRLDLQGDLAAADARSREARELLEQAEDLRKKGKSELAISTYRRSLELDESSSAAWHNLGTLLLDQKDYMGAATALRAAADRAPTDPRPLESLGLVYHRAGYDEKAISYYFESLERDPNWLGSIRGVAICSHRLNSASDQILEILDRGVMRESDDAWSMVIKRERIRVKEQLRADKESLRRDGR